MSGARRVGRAATMRACRPLKSELAMQSPLLVGLPPVLDQQTRIVILGSFPGEASLSAKRYYAHHRNQFWRLMSAVTNEPLADMDYDERLARLLAHQIGLWDTIAACECEGSLDACHSSGHRSTNSAFCYGTALIFSASASTVRPPENPNNGLASQASKPSYYPRHRRPTLICLST